MKSTAASMDLAVRGIELLKMPSSRWNSNRVRRFVRHYVWAKSITLEEYAHSSARRYFSRSVPREYQEREDRNGIVQIGSQISIIGARAERIATFDC